MEDLIFQFGYLGLFIVSFLAATLIPLGSEIFAVSMTLADFNPWIIFATATLGNSLGAITNYYVGKYGTDFILSRFISVAPDKRQKVEKLYKKWGSPILFFGWLPIIGDPLTLVAGCFNLRLSIFIFWVVLGKAFRYALIIFTAGTL